MKLDWKLTAGTVAIAGALALPASAAATPTLSAPLPACISTPGNFKTASLTVNVTGGGPNDIYDAYAKYPGTGGDEGGSPSASFDANGNASFLMKGLYPLSGGVVKGVPLAIDIEDDTPAGEVLTTLGSVLVTDSAISVPGLPDNYLKARTIGVSGTQFAGKKLYGFVTNPAGTVVYKHFFLGTGNVCGYAAHSEVIAPPKLNRTYRVYVNPGDKLNKKASLSMSFFAFHFQD